MPRKIDSKIFARRRKKALAAVGKKAGCLLVTSIEDVGYLTGFVGIEDGDGFLLIAKRFACLLTDGRYGQQARGECPGLEIIVRREAMPAAVAGAVRRRRFRRLGVQAEHVTLAMRDRLAKALKGIPLVPLKNVIAPLRAVKDAGEVAAIRRAAAVAQKAFKELIAGGAKALLGRMERDIAAELDYRMRLAGADEPAFDTIVAVGPHAALPHYQSGSARVAAGKAVLIDWGAKVAGYCSDLTRVVFIGTIPPKLTAVYEVVARAQRAGIAAIAPGAKASAVDEAARKVVEAGGYGDRFVHGLGHGIGRSYHEPPGLGWASDERLKAGMVVTVEPGVYLPGVGGVRIEDDVLVTPLGGRKLSSLPTAAAEMVLK